ncbi:DGQHR domain-containing protein [Comamonas jiangduensis]|uniref:DGQHR domain-containing protein n=1 Tax=Comamonas jiangduensis TaxID=1194168 RepID=UPI003BF8B7D6
MTTIVKPAFSIGNASIDYYVTVMTANEIFEFSKVSRVDEDANVGYQRHLSEKRADAIADYINAGNIIPGAVILSAQKNAELKFEDGNLTINLIPGSFFVIDGQHRLYGSKKADAEISLPVCILDGLDHAAEVKYFIDINSTQKGVPKTLRIELMKFLSEPDSVDAIRNRLFKDLNESPESPLYERMSATSSAPGRLSLVPFQAAIDPLINGDILGQFVYEDKKKLLINFLSAVEGALEKMDESTNRLTTSAFFQAIFKIFDKVCNLSIMHNKNYSLESMSMVMDGIVSIDLSRHTGSNQAAINDLASELSTLLELHSQKLGTPSGLL